MAQGTAVAWVGNLVQELLHVLAYPKKKKKKSYLKISKYLTEWKECRITENLKITDDAF